MSQGERPLINQYAIYDKDDNLLTVGNIQECCDYLEISRSTFYVTLNKDLHNRRKFIIKYKIIKIEE